MGDQGGAFPRGPEESIGRVLNRDLFLFILDIEVKRSRRYQNFLCLMHFKINQFSQQEDRGSLQACHRKLSHLLMEETRESDIIGARCATTPVTRARIPSPMSCTNSSTHHLRARLT